LALEGDDEVDPLVDEGACSLCRGRLVGYITKLEI